MQSREDLKVRTPKSNMGKSAIETLLNELPEQVNLMNDAREGNERREWLRPPGFNSPKSPFQHSRNYIDRKETL